MKLCYAPLLQVQLRHTFYRAGQSVSDFRVRPTAATQRLLDDRAFLFKAARNQFGVYAEVTPDSDPATLRRAIDNENLSLRFQLEPLHAYLFNISKLDHYRIGRELFCFDNLRSDPADGRRYLGDSIANVRLGDAVRLQTATVVDYVFAAPVDSAQLSLFDRFSNQLDSRAIQAPAGQGPLKGYRYDLAKVHGMAPGRYRLQDDQGGALPFYYDPELFGADVFGVIEMFNRTGQLTPDNTDRVPATYRFLDGEQIISADPFTLQLENRSTRWRYTVSKKYDNNAISLAQINVSGPVAFNRADGPQRVVFTANAPLPLAEVQQKITLAHQGVEIRSLPNPSMSSPVDGSAAEGIKYSDIYVYV